MIQAVIRRGASGRKDLLIGLTRENCTRLLKDKPITVQGTLLGLPFNVLVIGGETEESIRAQLINLGLITEATEHRTDPACVTNRAEQLYTLIHNGKPPPAEWAPEARRFYQSVVNTFDTTHPLLNQLKGT